jgi:hypothetical protein
MTWHLLSQLLICSNLTLSMVRGMLAFVCRLMYCCCARFPAITAALGTIAIKFPGTWAGHECSAEDGMVVIRAGDRTVRIPYSQAKTPADVSARAASAQAMQLQITAAAADTSGLWVCTCARV